MNVEHDGQEPAGGDPAGEPDDSWYFDLPSGAWERQEAKNKELRENVRRNINSTDVVRPDPFRSPNRGPADDGRRPGMEPRWRLNRGGGSLPDANEPIGDSKAGKSSEPELSPQERADAARQAWLSRPLLRRKGDDEAPGDDSGTAPGGFGAPRPGEADGAPVVESMRGWAHQAAARHEAAAGQAGSSSSSPAPVPLLRREEPAMEVTAGAETEQLDAGAEASRSRWDEMFGGASEGGSPEGGSILDSMRDWAAAPPVTEQPQDEPRAIPDEFLKPFEWEAEEVASGTQAQEDAWEAQVLEPVAAWRDALPSGDPVEEEDQGAPALPLPFSGEARDGDWNVIPWPEPVAEVPPQPEAYRPEVSEEPGGFDLVEDLARVVEDPDASGWSGPPAEEDVPAPAAEKKRGLLGRLFGKKAKDQQPESVADLEAAVEASESALSVAEVSEAAAAEWPAASAPTSRDWEYSEGVETPAALQPGEGVDPDVSPHAWQPVEEDDQPAAWAGHAVAGNDPDPGQPSWSWEDIRSDASPPPVPLASGEFEPGSADGDVPSWPDPAQESVDDVVEPEGAWEPRKATYTEAEAAQPVAIYDGWERGRDREEESTRVAMTEPAEPDLPGTPEEGEFAAAAAMNGSGDGAGADDGLPAVAAHAWSGDEPEEDAPFDFARELAKPMAQETAFEAPVLLRPASDEDPWHSVEAVEMPPTQPAAELPEQEAAAPPGASADPWEDIAASEAASEPAPAAQRPTYLVPVPPAEEAEPGASDDPWAAFLATHESDGPRPFASPATATSGAAVSWDTAFAPNSDHTDGDTAEPGDAPVDDPWAAVAAATGYDAASPDGIAIFRGATHQPAEDDLSRFTDPPAREAPPLFSVPAEPDFPGEPEANFADQPEREQRAPTRIDTWRADDDEDDVVLRAFEAHATARLEDDLPPGELAALGYDESEAASFEPLLGKLGADLIDEVSPPEQRSAMARLQGLKPPRAAGGGVAVPPWQAPLVPGATPVPPPPPEEEGWTPGIDGDGDGFLPWPDDFGPPGDSAPGSAVAGHFRGRTLVRELVETGLLAILVFLAVRASFQNFKVDGNSMFPTLEDGQFLIVNKLVYSEVDVEKLSRFLPFLDAGDSPTRHVFHGAERGDIVVLQDPRKPETDLIKRVIGLPGETIEIVEGRVYINDYLLEEPYIKSPWHNSNPKVLIPQDQYFVMGDNRDNSLDSRSQQVGLVPKELIIGKAMLSYWPASAFGLAPNGSPKLTTQTRQAAAQRIADPVPAK